MIQNIKVREIQIKDIKSITQYWSSLSADAFLEMGADIEKFPRRKQFSGMLNKQINTPLHEKNSYALIWEYQGKQVGHCNVNQLVYGKHAHIHLHLWNGANRKKGMGTALLKNSIPFFFENLKLKNLWCEPYAKNPAPNNTLPKVEFKLIKKYETIPGPINHIQEVCQYKMTKNRFKEYYFID